jgi:O-antigen/teichoic acid export membrane protein
MPDLLKKLRGSTLVKGSLLIFIANNAANFGNFLYNLFMGRLLGPEKYGELGAVLSVLVLAGVPLGILGLLVIKIVSAYWGKKDLSQVHSFYTFLTPKLLLGGIAVGIFLVVIQPLISEFIHIESNLSILLVAGFLTFSFLYTSNRSFLTGLMRFPLVTVNGIVEIVIKLIVAIVLVLFNFGVAGAISGLLTGAVAALILSVVELRIIFGKVIRSKVKKMETGILTDSFMPVLLVSLSMTFFITVDIILVRHFFSSFQAGQYTALSAVGRIGFYGVSPVISVMFPLISGRAARGVTYILPLLGTLVFVLLVSSGLVFINFLFPNAIISLLYGAKYSSMSSLLGMYSFFITIYAINAVLTYFLLSVSYYKPMILLFIISMSQGVLIFIFHNSISDVIWTNIITGSIYLAAVLVFTVKKEQAVIGGILKKIKPQGVYG